MTIFNLSHATLTRYVEVFGKNNTNGDTYTWLINSTNEPLKAYRTPVSLGGQLPMPDSIAELEGSPLNTLMQRIEWVIKWYMTGLNDRGWAVPDQLKEPYEDHLHLIKSTEMLK